MVYNYGEISTKFNGIFARKNSLYSTHGNVVNFFGKLDIWSRVLNTNLILGGCLFEAVKLTKNANSGNYQYSGSGTGFDANFS